MVDKLNSTDIFVGGIENLDGDFRASATISAGDVVKLDGTTTGSQPDVSPVDTAGTDGFGVAAHDASSGEAVTVIMTGGQARTKVATGTSAISPGDQLTANGSGSEGGVKAVGTSGDEVVGKALTSSVSNEVVMLVDTGGDNA